MGAANAGFRWIIGCGRPRRLSTQRQRRCRRNFKKLCAKLGQPPIAPEKLLRALLLHGSYSVSERQLMEQLGYNLLFRWLRS